MSDWTILPLPLYRFQSPGPEVYFQGGFGEMVDMTIYAFLVQHAGATVLVDTGLPLDFASLNRAIRDRKGPQAGFEPLGDDLPLRLREMGVEPDLIVLSSLGPYAIGGIDRLDAPICASERGLRDMRCPEEPALIHPIPAEHQARLANAREVAGEAEPIRGIRLVEVGIHHPASLAIIVDTEAGPVALPDPVFVKRNLTDGIALGASEFAAGWHGMVRRLGQSAHWIIPIHDRDPSPVAVADWHASLQISADSSSNLGHRQ